MAENRQRGRAVAAGPVRPRPGDALPVHHSCRGRCRRPPAAPTAATPRNPLFLLNNWVDTSPLPRPSNAAVVNAPATLLRRARTCQRLRGPSAEPGGRRLLRAGRRARRGAGAQRLNGVWTHGVWSFPRNVVQSARLWSRRSRQPPHPAWPSRPRGGLLPFIPGDLARRSTRPAHPRTQKSPGRAPYRQQDPSRRGRRRDEGHQENR